MFTLFSLFITMKSKPTFKNAFYKARGGEFKLPKWENVSFINLACLAILTGCGDGSGTQASVSESSLTTRAMSSTASVSTDSVSQPSLSQLASTSTASDLTTGVSAESVIQPSVNQSSLAAAATDSTTGISAGSVTPVDGDKLANSLQIAAVRGMADRRTTAARDVVSADAALYSTVSWGQVPKNGFIFLNNNFGKGNLVNGVDYKSILTAQASTFPANAVLQWNWPNATSGSAFAYAYPEIIYGGTPWGNPYRSVGPWPQKVKDNIRLIANYDITLGGNVNSYNVLLDVYLTDSSSSVDGSHTAEISFFPHLNDPGNLTNVIMFSFGRASVTRQGKQILVRPVNALHTPTDLLSSSINIKEVLDYLVSIHWISGEEYLRGAEFGVEVQVPNYYNSTPHQGSMTVNRISYDWK